MQVQEQIDAFITILTALQYRTEELDLRINSAFSVPIQISIGIRHNSVECICSVHRSHSMIPCARFREPAVACALEPGLS